MTHTSCIFDAMMSWSHSMTLCQAYDGNMYSMLTQYNLSTNSENFSSNGTEDMMIFLSGSAQDPGLAFIRWRFTLVFRVLMTQ